MKRRFLAAALIGVLASLPAVAEPIRTPLMPGTIAGGVNVIKRPTISLDLLASYYGVHDSRVKPAGKGQLTIDQRRILPQFYPWVSGIVLNVPEAHVYLVENGKIVKDYPAGVSRTDWPVPLGQFKVLELRKNPTWYVPKSIQEEMAEKGEEVKTEVGPGPDNPLGTRWIGFADGTYGFHGTPSPGSIKEFRSHGCVRMFDKDVQDLFDRVKMGTPVRVYYQPVTLAVDGESIWLASYPDVYKRYRSVASLEEMVRELAGQAGVLDRLDWAKVRAHLKARNGSLVDVALSAQKAAS